ncbi:MAG TPA: sugar ABC transporter permease [Candidatus Limnocylindrales bacterium]|nr:sugar ABC transporter permease [Candidatus Limnocylindrales bacterium]
MTTIAARLRIGPAAPATSKERLAYRLLLPVFGTVVVVATIPFVLAVIESVTRGGEFVGLANYVRALSNPLLADSVRQTAIYGLIVVPSEILLGLGLALLVHRTIRSAAVKAAIYVLAIIPIVMPGVASGVIFRLIYAPEYGLLNFILEQAGIIEKQILWLSVPQLAMLSVASVDIWQWTAFVYLVLFAGLQTVPHEAVEAAQVDGASGWAQFRNIELPFIRPLVLLVLFFRIADVLRVFDHVFILTGGGPGTTTEFLSLYLYRIAFKFSDLPQASALAVMMMVGMTVFYTVILRFMPLETD